MKINITNIDSAIITSFEYNYETKEMTIGYKGFVSYLYKDVEPNIVLDFIEAESKGKYINSIKNDYEFDKLEEPTGTFGLQSNLI